MQYTIHRSWERGTAEHGWLHSRFSFSFAAYNNPDRMGFGALRVINDDIIEPAKGFSMHPHQNMEIISVVTSGALEHKDSSGNHDVIRAGEIQYMSAGAGVFHSEFNPSDTETAELFQVWILPSEIGGKVHYAKRDFTPHDHRNRWVTLVANDGAEGAMPIKQNARILTGRLDAGCCIALPSVSDTSGRMIFVVEGTVETGGETLRKRDEMQITDADTHTVRATEDATVMVFEVPMNPKG